MALPATSTSTTAAAITTWFAPNVAVRWSSFLRKWTTSSRKSGANISMKPPAILSRFMESAKTAARRTVLSLGDNQHACIPSLILITSALDRFCPLTDAERRILWHFVRVAEPKWRTELQFAHRAERPLALLQPVLRHPPADSPTTSLALSPT